MDGTIWSVVVCVVAVLVLVACDGVMFMCSRFNFILTLRAPKCVAVFDFVNKKSLPHIVDDY